MGITVKPSLSLFKSARGGQFHRRLQSTRPDGLFPSRQSP